MKLFVQQTEEANYNFFKVASDWLYHSTGAVSAHLAVRETLKKELFHFDLLASNVLPYYLAAGWLPIFQYTVESRVVLFPALNIS